jgi:hypothetical protein
MPREGYEIFLYIGEKPGWVFMSSRVLHFAMTALNAI